jgi:hypothetical protein
LAECYPDRIEALNPGLDAVVTAAAERACPETGEAGRRLARGEEAGPLHGLPMTIPVRAPQHRAVSQPVPGARQSTGQNPVGYIHHTSRNAPGERSD